MTIAGKTVLVTGANRGIGQALAAEALARGASRVYAGTRQPLAGPDRRVTPLTLDVTSAAQIQAAAGQIESLDIDAGGTGRDEHSLDDGDRHPRGRPEAAARHRRHADNGARCMRQIRSLCGSCLSSDFGSGRDP
jgi:NAD(P)-dependent dehydrogenase (short-subunit alcohol dehydrogenase family)